jgi:hypothetical protein
MDSVYNLLGKDKYKDDIFRNQYPIILSLVAKLSVLKNNPDLKVKPDGTKPESVEQFIAICQKVIGVAENVIATYPDPTHQNNKFAQDAKAAMVKYIDYFSKPPQPVKKGSGGGGAAPGKG